METDKKSLRKTCRNTRDSISEQYREQAGNAMVERLRELPEYQSARTICAYVSMQSEVPTRQLLEQVWQEGKQLFLPRMTVVEGIMEMVAVESNSPMTTGPFGVQEPDAALAAIGHHVFDLVVVPALAYDKQGYRLGYGGGYYDRFMAELAPQTTTIGLCYQCLLLDEVPRNQYDQSVDVVITEQQVLRIR